MSGRGRARRSRSSPRQLTISAVNAPARVCVRLPARWAFFYIPGTSEFALQGSLGTQSRGRSDCAPSRALLSFRDSCLVLGGTNSLSRGATRAAGRRDEGSGGGRGWRGGGRGNAGVSATCGCSAGGAAPRCWRRCECMRRGGAQQVKRLML